MGYERTDQGDGLSDHEKFGEQSTFGSTASNTTERVEGAANEVRDRMSNAAGTVRERAGQLKATLADKLETGAEKLRQRTTDTSRVDHAVTSTKEAVAGASDRVAARMENTAEWLRGADMASIQRGIERQVKENPGRTLLVAAGLGYLLGRAFKGRES
jgi:ElaB/YqjD/DUF883 family membrane-anchored ribosome-binding protein